MKPITRICPPSRYDRAPHGTLCYVNGENKIDGYIQMSNDDEHPQWMPIGEFLWAVFREDLQNTEFIDECLHHYYEMRS